MAQQGKLILEENEVTQTYYQILADWGNKIVSDNDVKSTAPVRVLIINPMPASAQANVERNLIHALGQNTSGLTVKPEILRADVERFDDRVVMNFPQEQVVQIKQDMRDGKITGVILMGASADHVSYENVQGIETLYDLLDCAAEHTGGGFTICWGSMVGLKHFHGIDKYVNHEVVIGYPSNKVIEGKFDPIAEGMKKTKIVPVGCVGRIDDSLIEAAQKRGEVEILARTTDIDTVRPSSISLLRSDRNSKGEKIAPFYHTGVHLEYGKRAIPQEIVDKLANPQGGIPLIEAHIINDPRKYKHEDDILTDWYPAMASMMDAFLTGAIAYKAHAHGWGDVQELQAVYG